MHLFKSLGVVAILVASLSACSADGKHHTVPGVGITDSDVDTDIDTLTSQADPWLRDEIAAPGSISFDEIYYHPVDEEGGGDEGLEWLELYNPMAIDMDLSGWALGGGVAYAFGEGTILSAGGFLVVAADPARVANALGPWEGTLSDGGARINLLNNGGRLIDTVAYGDDDPWPVEADGSGLSLAKINPEAASDHAEHWTASAQMGGTPGTSNLLNPLAPSTTVDLVALDAFWTYDVSGDYPAADWAAPGYDDSGWDSGQAVFFAGGVVQDVRATLRVTADNFYGAYIGDGDGGDLRLVGEDVDGSWTTVDEFEVDLTAQDHLYLAAWESPADYGGPQMTIAEVELPDDVVGTNASGFEWILGPTDGCPGISPGDPPPTADALSPLIQDAVAAASWEVPAVEADRSSDPWGWATSTAFVDAKYVWVDTFGDTSITNTENTYALFRSREPLLGSRGTTELPAIPTTTTFRTSFAFDADPASAVLSLACLLDDGAIFTLNGVEVLRQNMPAGTVDATTRATAPVTDASTIYADISSDALVRGLNVLAVEVHQAEANDLDMTFGCALTAEISTENAGRTIVLNEVAAAADAPFWVELLGVSLSDQQTSGLLIASSAGGELVLPAGTLGPGDLLVLDDVGFAVEAGDVLFLYSADRGVLLDAVRVHSRARGRASDGGPWRFPGEATPGGSNVIDVVVDVVINELQYHRAPLSREGEPVTARSEEWIELYNRGDAYVDLSGWQLVDAVGFAFPSGTVVAPNSYLVVAGDAATLAAQHPGIPIVGDYSGRLDNGGDRVLLLDAGGNPADEVRYFDGGRWPEACDGGGSSLELRDPLADNAVAEAWGASEEGARSEWVTYSYRGEADPSAVGPDGAWEELVVGLLDGGEVLIDDVSVIKDPDESSVELIQNGTFDASGAAWRLLGNHRHSEVVPDPDDPANPVLRLVASGPTGHMHNHAGTTLLQPIRTREYAVSFRARWISGSNQLNTRLYFNRLPRTTRVAQPDLSGTPGAPNSVALDNLGPTFADLGQDVAVPAAYQRVRISLSVDDPDGVDGVALFSSVGGAPFGEQAMTELEPGRWEAELVGQPAGTIVQMYVQAEDLRGARSTFPAAGPDSRALVRFDDGLAATNGLHNFRILMTEADSDWLHDDVNLMSDDLVGATVVYDEAEVFYDVGVRAKGSERGRPEVPRLGYGVAFHSEQPFRGSHSSVLIDRSEGVGYGQREVLMNLVMTHAGSVSGEYNDLVQAMTPRSEHTGPAELQLDRFSDLVLESQFLNGASGSLFEYELIYYPLTTDDGTAEGLKLPKPDDVVGTPITDLGEDQESWRWNFLIQNNEREDDYDRLMDLGRCFSLSDSDCLTDAEAVIDVDQWLRAFAFATLSGAVDNYGSDGSQHNARFYVRPEDQRVLYFPHDLDYYGGSNLSVVGNGDLARLLQDPAHSRSYYGHLQDIVGRAYNAAYLAPWCEQMGRLLSGQDIAGHCQFIADRAEWVMNGSPDAVMALYPTLDFRITTGGGADISVAATEVVIEGEAWIDVRQIVLDGTAAPLDVAWTDEGRWQVTVPLADGRNDLNLIATDLRGAVVGTDSIGVTSTGG